MQLPQPDAGRQAQPDLREVQGPGIRDSMFRLRGKRMEREITDAVFKVSGPGLHPPDNHRRMFLVVALSGFVLGLDVATMLYLHARRPIAELVQGGLAIICAAAATWILFLEGRRLRAWRVELARQMDDLYETARADLTQQWPNDPAFVDAIVDRMRNEFERQTGGKIKP
jgi:hypothetical protein